MTYNTESTTVISPAWHTLQAKHRMVTMSELAPALASQPIVSELPNGGKENMSV